MSIACCHYCLMENIKILQAYTFKFFYISGIIILKIMKKLCYVLYLYHFTFKITNIKLILFSS